MNLRTSLLMLVSAVSVAAGISACSAPADDEGAGAGEDEIVTREMFGDDRVGKTLKGHLDKIPTSFPEFEKLFKVGRECARTDSKEIFIVEEAQTRLVGPEEKHENSTTTRDGQVATMPRAVVTGCNTGDKADPATVRNSYTLMAALISDPSQDGSEQGDTMSLSPLEVMAYDETSGLYNFYVFEKSAAGKPQMTRIWRAPDGTVFQRRYVTGKGLSEVKRPIGGGNRCFNCHVNGAPLMNEMREPWTNWISFRKDLPEALLSGTTKELVSEASPQLNASDPRRASLAGDLETTMRAAIQNYVNGGKRTNGWANRTVNGELPGGLAHMLESVFCQTELNYASSVEDKLPTELYFDPDAVASSGIWYANSTGDGHAAFQFPIRSERDKATERWLVKAGYLSDALVMAIRLLDDENDIYSAGRCKVLDSVKNGLPVKPADVQEHVRKQVLASIAYADYAQKNPARLDFQKALLTPGVRRETKLAAYNAELQVRSEAMDKSTTFIRARERFRKARAREQFDTRSTPLPLLDR